MNPLLIQTISYGIVLIFAIMIISLLQRGFFWAFLRVKVSFGKLIMVKIRSVNRDFFRVGKIIEGFLVYKGEKGDKRISVKDNSVFYRALGVAWVDLEDVKGALSKTDYTGVTGYDPEKYNSLYLRALYKPAILDTKEKLILAGVGLLLILVGLCLYLLYDWGNRITLMQNTLESMKSITVSQSTGL